ncbi:MAG: hypothetical protein QNL05_02350 [Gammaproteobacteria bacterium]|nr:hypothetical protein [Gammaproteobacteria bacterium]
MGILKRYGGDVIRARLVNWMLRLSLQWQPLIKRMRVQHGSADVDLMLDALYAASAPD